MPKGVVSFERKVLPFEGDADLISYPKSNFWSTSAIPLCKFEVHTSGHIEDQSGEAVEVDFANKYLIPTRFWNYLANGNLPYVRYSTYKMQNF